MSLNKPFMTEPLVDAAAKSLYDKNGYLLLERAVTPEACDALAALAQPFGESPDYPVTLNIHRKRRAFGEFMMLAALREAVATLHGAPVCGLNSQYLFKRHGTKYGRQSWVPHQDNAYPQAEHGALSIVHLMIDDSGPENGGLVFWEGSHVEPILDYEWRKSWREDADEDDITRPGRQINNIPDKYEAINIEAPKGSLCFMHGNLVHGSAPNMSQSRNRQQYSMGFINQGSDFLRGEVSIKMIFTPDHVDQVPVDPETYVVG
jgi:ectoine hydroxylase-related dioxygenase (phytanoyl-CoA dioxygenase family)